PDAIDHLDTILARLADPVDTVRASAIDALRHLRRTELTATVRAFLEDPDWLVQNAALSFLVWAEPEFGAAEAIARLKDPRPRVREHSIDLIDELTDGNASDAAWEVILPLIGDRDRAVRASARWYLTNRLERVLPERTHLATSPAEWIRAVSAASLAAVDPVAALRVHARDESRVVRLALVEELATIANETALREARAVCRGQIDLLLRDPEARVREATLDIASF
ncbi:MAG: HEAT repeat domain-containing protein, partial [Chloroflexota bacterium]|nr:HEAT repeat domain-containing protein [Chloroflexota bacterium]